jgi:hypothetical protein
MPTERQIEKRLRLEVECRGAKAYKFVSPGTAGVPDRLILFPGGRTVFVELKRPGEHLRPLQEKRAAELRALGFKVYCIDSIETVRGFVREEFA